MTTHEYMTMCTGVLDFYTENKTMINGVDGLEVHFSNLHIMLINLSNQQERLRAQIGPLLKEKECETDELEQLFHKFNETFKEVSSDNRKGRKKKEKEPAPSIRHLSPSEIIEQYQHISEKARTIYRDLLPTGMGNKELQKLETMVTQYIISLPVTNLLHEKTDHASMVENKMIAEMEYLFTHQIDPQMSLFSRINPTMYKAYQQCRSGLAKDNTDKRDAYVLA